MRRERDQHDGQAAALACGAHPAQGSGPAFGSAPSICPPEDGYRLDVTAIAGDLTPRTRLVIVTTPHNPSGCRIDPNDLLALGELMAPQGWVLVDEVYLDVANLAAGRAPTGGSAARLDGPFIVTSSLTKSYGLAGLKCGWAIASPNNAERLRRTRDLVDNASSAPADRLSALALASLPALAERARALLRRNLDEAILFSSAHPELELAGPPESSVIFPRLRGVHDAGAYVESLLANGVAVAPGFFFDAPAHFRISLAGETNVLRAGLRQFPSGRA
jgi:aspartate/methionine/tyrosine aminotransferase